jgi:hypothetical protein
MNRLNDHRSLAHSWGDSLHRARAGAYESTICELSCQFATRTCCHLISLGVTQCHDRTVPKLFRAGYRDGRESREAVDADVGERDCK